MTKPLTAEDLLKDALHVLQRIGCQFLECDGPDVPSKHMKTCGVCREIRRIRKYFERNTCTCPREPHVCPFKVEISDDYEECTFVAHIVKTNVGRRYDAKSSLGNDHLRRSSNCSNRLFLYMELLQLQGPDGKGWL